jgi:PKD repeat protein
MVQTFNKNLIQKKIKHQSYFHSSLRFYWFIMKNNLRTLAFLFFYTFLIGHADAQLSAGGFPRSSLGIVQTTDVPMVQLPAIDLKQLLAEDQERARLGKEFDRRFGKTFDVQFMPANSGVWKTLPNGDRIWQMKIGARGAFSINLTFHKFYLPPGADLFLIGKKNTIGALTAANNQSDQKLGTGLIGGEEILVEYYEPISVQGQGILEISKATHGYKNPFAISGFGESGSCNMNVNCPRGLPWQNQKRAVARIIDNGDACTGSLINNSNQDGKPYFLTANHCFNNATSTWVFSFNWEAPTCTNPNSAPPENQTIAGSTLRARWADSDFLLLELSSRPPASFNVYYAGWNANRAPAQKTTIIHHPSGDIKKITFDEDPPLTWGYGISNPNDTTHWRTVNYEFGTTTEGGSSGSPLFDHNQRIVGQLHGGPASCTNISSDFYGKFSLSWNGGNSNTSRLRNWLDPANLGILALDGMDPGCRKLTIRLPYIQRLDTVLNPIPSLWKVKNPDNDSTFSLVTGGFPLGTGKAFVIRAENAIPSGRLDTLLVAPVSVNKFKNLKFGFRRAYRSFQQNSSDQVELLVSRNCGSTFSLLQTWTGAGLTTDPQTGNTNPFHPTDSSFFQKTWVNLDSTFNRADQLVFAFRFTSGNAGTLWLDDIQIAGDSAGTKPTARFTSNATTGCPGANIQFFDSSLYNPTNRIWRFQGGNPATSTLVNPVVSYANPGLYKVSITVSNSDGSDSLVTNGYVNIFNLGSAQTPLLQAFGTGGTFPPTGYILLNPNANRSWEVNANVNAPGSTGGSMMYDNYSNPNNTGERDNLILPKISTAGKTKLRMRLSYAYKYFQNFGGSVAPDTLTISFASQCGGTQKSLWKKGGIQLATAGNTGTSYTPVAADWQTIFLVLDSLLSYPEVSLSFENLSGFGNRIFIDDILIDTSINCPDAPVLSVNNDSLCIGSQLVLSMDSLAGATYAWTGPANFTSSSRIATRTLTNTNQGGIYRGVVSKNGCSSPPTSQTILVSSLPAVPTITVNGNTLTGPANQASYMWIFNGDTLDVTSRTHTITASGTVILVVGNSGGCTRASVPRNVVFTSAASNFLTSDFELIPNPANASVSIQGISQVDQFVIFDVLGKKVLSGNQNLSTNPEVNQIDISAISDGVYWIQILNRGKWHSAKLLIQH